MIDEYSDDDSMGGDSLEWINGRIFGKYKQWKIIFNNLIISSFYTYNYKNNFC